MNYTVIYLSDKKFPRETFKLQFDVKDHNEALDNFINLELSVDMFVVAIIKGSLKDVFYTR